MLIFLLHAELGIVLTFEPVSTIAAVSGAVVSVGIAGYSFIHCRFGECCDDRWITSNITGKLLLYLIKIAYNCRQCILYGQLVPVC